MVKPRERRIPIMFSEEELEAIDNWRFENRIATRADAMRKLCQLGLIFDSHLELLDRYSLETVANSKEDLSAAENSLERVFTCSEKHLSRQRTIQMMERKLYRSTHLHNVINGLRAIVEGLIDAGAALRSGRKRTPVATRNAYSALDHANSVLEKSVDEIERGRDESIRAMALGNMTAEQRATFEAASEAERAEMLAIRTNDIAEYSRRVWLEQLNRVAEDRDKIRRPSK